MWLLSALGSSHTAAAQQPWRWECGPMRFGHATQMMYFDEFDSSLYVSGNFDTVNGAYHKYMVRMRPDGSVQSMPYIPMIAQTMLRWNGELYAGANSSIGAYLLRWDDTAWTQLIYMQSDMVTCLYPYQGKLLVGGVFDDVPDQFGNTESVLKVWDGNTLSTFKGLDSVLISHGVYAITEFQGDLVVAGNLIPYTPANPLFKDIIRWTGTSWQPLGNVGLPGSGLDEVSSMKVINGELYVAGFFQELNGSPGNGIAKWDGTQWHRLGSGTGPTMVGIYDLEMQGDTLLVGGTFRTMNGDTAWKMARYWNGIWCGNKTRYLGPDVVTSLVNYHDTVIVAGAFWDSANASAYACNWMGKLVEWDEGCFARGLANVPSTPENASVGLRVSPNPAHDRVRIDYTAARAGEATIRLLDMVGRIVLTRTTSFTTGANHLDLGTADLPNGVYHISLSSAAAHEAVKFVKQ